MAFLPKNVYFEKNTEKGRARITEIKAESRASKRLKRRSLQVYGSENTVFTASPPPWKALEKTEKRGRMNTISVTINEGSDNNR